MRDFIHIEDCIDIVLATMDKVEDASPLNLSTGVFTSFIDLMQTASRLCGKTLQFKTQSDKPEGVFARGGDTARQLAFGCRPKIALQDGIQKALDFRKELDSRQKVAV
jgi:GDP-L-fucose synthase